MLFSDDVVVATRLTQGCAPVGPEHVVTDSRQNILISLDGRPALDIFREDIGPEFAGNLGLVAGRIFAALPIEGNDSGDYVVRNLAGLDTTHKLVALSESVRPGRSVLFCRRDRGTASDDLERMLTSIRSGLYRQPKGGVYFSCLGRGASLFGDNSEELRIIRDALGEVPLVGFFCNGEISHNRLYGYTGVLTLFSIEPHSSPTVMRLGIVEHRRHDTSVSPGWTWLRCFGSSSGGSAMCASPTGAQSANPVCNRSWRYTAATGGCALSSASCA